MGNEESLVKLDPNKKLLDLSRKGITSIDNDIEDLKTIYHLLLNGNHIRDLPEDLPELKTIQLRDNDYSSIPDRIAQKIKNFPNLVIIDFSYNSITKIPKPICESTSLASMCFFNNSIAIVPKLNDILVQVDLGQNKLKKFPFMPKNLTKIALDYNQIEILNDKHEEIRKIVLQRNLLKEIGPQTYFPNLLQIDLSFNNLKAFPPNFDQMVPKLKGIFVSHNQLQVYPKLPLTIQEVDLSFNLIDKVPDNFGSFTCLCRCNLSNNKIVKISQVSSTLQSLNLNNNEVKDFQLNHLPDLAHLYLMGNKLSKLPPVKGIMFNNMYLRYNRISTLNCNYLVETTHVIDLSFNEIKEIPDEFFQLESLFDLILTGNKITSVNPNIINSNLSRLNLSANPLSELPELPDSLEELYINDCNFKTLDEKLAENKNLITLHANGNKLTTIPYIPSLQNIELASNGLTECPKLPNGMISINLAFNSIENLPELNSKDTLEFLDVSYNPLKSIPSLKSYIQLKYLILTGTLLNMTVSFDHMPIYIDSTSAQISFPPKTIYPYYNFNSTTEEGSRYRSINNFVVYTTKPSEYFNHGDFIISQIPPKVSSPVFGIIDRTSNIREAKIFADKMLESLKKSGYTKKGFKKAFQKSMKQLNIKGYNSYYSCSFAAIQNNKIICGLMGGASAFISTKTELFHLGGYKPFTMFATKHSIYGHLYDEPNKSEFYVHKTTQKQEILAYKVDDSLRFLILISRAVVDTLSFDEIKKCVLSSSNAQMAASNIMTMATSAMCNDNISVLAVYLPPLVI
ncbi:Leucine Rich Repeat family protein [Trichomonas vaginalis G3]|uniref:Leucine Rich Repeat family protein n=1 Tax=Trichomonas vaginalis (strain ATCC PRA-98 / G3) TaxID=412133 RepID=A2DI52_TRIV3|nr:uncharacterized protein TVAGG3_0712640 [Trichomonas vaginalis G3]EAY19848.1 Leucine Rich Repeat family protein [Trichomonas vaginalis G3]KAI5510023.1 regulation of response to stimulus [Trichomonas vaginalis G3]|eukprot:XP_001580834.1 hypothetical protein [Trichomonas vaginalis G3]